MEKPAAKVASSDKTGAEMPSLEKVVEVVFESAVDALVKTFLVLLFGSIAIGIASGVWRQMTPSVPPGYSRTPELESTRTGALDALGTALDQHRFLVVFGFIFAASLWRELGPWHNADEAGSKSRLRKIGGNLSRRWFELIVVNAFGAMIAAIVLAWVQQFSFVRLFFGWLLEALIAGCQNLIGLLLGPSRGESFRAWFDWYCDNQLKFNFWVFYLAAVCDDLGLPNFKTLGRWLGRRMRLRREAAKASKTSR